MIARIEEELPWERGKLRRLDPQLETQPLSLKFGLTQALVVETARLFREDRVEQVPSEGLHRLLLGTEHEPVRATGAKERSSLPGGGGLRGPWA